MAGMIPLPQTVTHSSTRLTHAEAHTLLSSFLAEAEINPSLRPDSQITPHAIQSHTTGSTGNITLTHLNRILQGIAGKRVGGVEFNLGTTTGNKRRKLDAGIPSSPPVNKSHEQIQGREVEDGQEEAILTARETGGWQDKDDYEHAQVDETGDLPGRDPADPNETNEAIEQQGRRDDLDVQSLSGQPLTRAEKEARKQAKKDKRTKEKREKEAKRQGLAK